MPRRKECRVGSKPAERTATQIIAELEEQAVEHKKLERRARALAQRTYATIREIEDLCRRSGIPVKREERKP